MKKTIKLTESDIHQLIKKVIEEQSNTNFFNKMVDGVKSGKCKVLEGGGEARARISCNDGTYYELNRYRRFGQ